MLARINVTLAGGGGNPDGGDPSGQDQSSAGDGSNLGPQKALATLKAWGALLGGAVVLAVAIWAWPRANGGGDSSQVIDESSTSSETTLDAGSVGPFTKSIATITETESGDSGATVSLLMAERIPTNPPAGSTDRIRPDPRPSLGAGARPLEVSILERARQELKNHRPERALELIERHARTYPDGMLRQEREALRIEALAAVGKRQEMKKSADRFREDFPDSPQRQRVDQVDGGDGQ